jgi:hypothetical protein
MGFIREPEGVDFFIQSRVLTSAEEKAISDFIRADKAKYQAQNIVRPNPRLFLHT